MAYSQTAIAARNVSQTLEDALTGAARPDWHTSDAFEAKVKAFHEKFAKQPSREMNEAKDVHNQYITDLSKKLKADSLILRLEYTGSSYEGVKVNRGDDHDLEFDVMVIMEGRKYIEAIPCESCPGFATLKAKFPTFNVTVADNKIISELQPITDTDGSLNASKTKFKLIGTFQKLIDNSDLMTGKVKLFDHGPAVQMNVYRCQEDLAAKKKLYSVDMVPTFEVGAGKEKELYVAKKLPDGTEVAWRQSFSLQEKEKFKAMDADGGCRKQVLRVLKVIRNREAGLTKLSSYHLKTALFKEIRDEAKFDKIGVALLNLIMRLENELSAGKMPHFFIPEVDLLHGIPAKAITNMRDRLRRLRSSEVEFDKVLKKECISVTASSAL